MPGNTDRGCSDNSGVEEPFMSGSQYYQTAAVFCRGGNNLLGWVPP